MGVYAFTLNTKFVTESCGECGVQFAMTEAKYEDAKTKGSTFYCTNGHARVYTTSKIKELENQLAAQKSSNEWYQKRLYDESKRVSAFKGQVTRIKNRVSNGVCPCCKRTFSNLANHIKHLHPEWKQSDN